MRRKGDDMTYCRQIVTIRRPDGTACGAAVWQERDGKIALDIQCTQDLGGQTLDVVLIERERTRRVGVWSAKKGTLTEKVTSSHAQGLALCTTDGQIAALGFLRGCTQSALAIRARLSAAYAPHADEPVREAREQEKITKETADSAEHYIIEEKTAPERSDKGVVRVPAPPDARRELIYQDGILTGQTFRAAAWPPLPLAPGAAHRDGVFLLPDMFRAL